MTPAARRQNAVTLALSVALTVAVGLSIYFAVTSLPFLALSPTADPVFGRLNECARQAVPARLGYAVRADLRAIAVFGATQLVRCEVDTAPETHELGGLTHAAFAADGTLWVSGPDRLRALKRGALVDGPKVRTQSLAPLGDGVALVDERGQLILLGPAGVGATVDLDTALEPRLSSSGDLQRLAVQLGPRVLVVDAAGTVRFDQVPCAVSHHVWATGHELLVTCDEPPSWALLLDVDTGLQRPAPKWPAAGVLRVGDALVEGCDGLPCSAQEPR